MVQTIVTRRTTRSYNRKNHAKLIRKITKLIENPEFVESHKRSSKDFIRNRTLSFKIVVLFLLRTIKESIQSELGSFFQSIEKKDCKVNKVSTSAFTQAREKLKHTAFRELDRTQIAFFYKNYDYKKWNGYRLVAIDGSRLALPYTEELHEKFGPVKLNQQSKKVVMSHISEAYDPLNKINLDACIEHYDTGEHNMLMQHLKHISAGDLILADRYYPAFWLYKLLISKNMDFCMRLRSGNRENFIKEFLKSGKKQAVVKISCPESSKQKCKQLKLDTNSIMCRLIRIPLPNGKTKVLISSLTDKKSIKYKVFKELYHLRWPVEENYKLLKCRCGLEYFSGKTIEAIYQDFYATIMLTNLTAILAFGVRDIIKEKSKNCKYSYQINWNNAMQNMKTSAILLFIRSQLYKIIEQILNLFYVNSISYRPNRKYPRKKHHKKQAVSMSYR